MLAHLDHIENGAHRGFLIGTVMSLLLCFRDKGEIKLLNHIEKVNGLE